MLSPYVRAMVTLNSKIRNKIMDIPLTLIIVTILIFSVIVHELAHGYVALYLGDPTAKLAGRLTLNPIPHLDPIGSVLIPLILALTPGGFIFGWAKPVPYNLYNLRNQKWGEALVAVAGPGMNLFLALVFGLSLRFFAGYLSLPTIEVMSFIVFINILLALFNLIPIPPLDGSKVVNAFLPYELWAKYNVLRAKIERLGFIGFFIFIFLFIYVFSGPFFALVSSIFKLITGMGIF